MSQVVHIGNASGFWGDRIRAAAELAQAYPDLDYLTLDYLAEVSMSILAQQRSREPRAGYARDFIEAMRLLAPELLRRRREQPNQPLRVITNAGGLNPIGCAEACRTVLLQQSGAACEGLRLGIVTGDDVLDLLLTPNDDEQAYANLETGRPLDAVRNRLVTANAYLGARPIVQALGQGADIVVTGRVADPSLTVAACVHHHGWSRDDFDRLAGATVAGHLIECGTQVTGGISSDWLNVPDPVHIGFPVAIVDVEGNCSITKPAGSGGCVTPRTVKEQLLYEIGDPGAYLSPDVTASFQSLRVLQEGPDRVRVSGATGSPPPPRYKVSATYRAGYRAAGLLVVPGPRAVAKAQRCAEIVRQRLREAGTEPNRWHVECLGAGDLTPTAERLSNHDPPEVVLRIAVDDARREVVEQFSRELMPLVTCGPQGITGYGEGRPRVHEVFGYWPCLIDRSLVDQRVSVTTMALTE